MVIESGNSDEGDDGDDEGDDNNSSECNYDRESNSDEDENYIF